ncbi:NAD(P)H-binding protein [Actinomadura rudentiformis]|uniref:NAD(P)H-binding protein n=1 Tax=Actinomadura rudentiformis TaxID=359158 RepID=A0A6H9Z2C8_9ACTN|nr:NAD(P)H-binding protein [Actinomadura rudentiformis]KAB2348426.1 NAD(P)H-binding protein [Actinomadura rudentiformis]
MILVSGATGNVGGELARRLAEAGMAVRALVRDPGKAPAGTEPVGGDLDHPESLTGALKGVEGVFLLSGYADMPGLLAEIDRAGVGRVVLLSGGAVLASDTKNVISRYMHESERAVRESGVPWTLLRPSGFMSNTLQWAPQIRAGGDVVRAPFPHVRIAMVDPYDIAAVAAEALLEDGHEGNVYNPTGPDPLLPADRVRILGEVLGRELRFEGQTNAQAREDMLATMPVEYVEAFFTFYADGKLDESHVLPTVREVTGNAPRTFAQWAAAHADAFR